MNHQTTAEQACAPREPQRSSTGQPADERPEEGAAYLVVVEGAMCTMVNLPRDGRLTVGRGEEADVRVQSLAASRVHAELSVVAGRTVLRDLGSRNGTHLNGARVEQATAIRSGDVVQLPGSMLVYHGAHPATGLASFGLDLSAFRTRGEEELERSLRADRPVSVLVLEFGELPELEATLRETESFLRAADLAGWDHHQRLLVLLPDTDRAGSVTAGERLLRALAKHAPTARAAVATHPEDAGAFDALLAAATAALDATPTGHVGRPVATVRRVELGGVMTVIGSPLMVEVFERTARLSRGEMPVLVTGETGVGKELVAAALHEWSSRTHKPFVCLNCAAIPEALVESELFGHERGAFSGAAGAKEGLIEAADGGTLFLDEIAELPLQSQAKLLRVLDLKRCRRVGAIREREVSVRVVTATNCDLEREVTQGRFRQDLYFRLRGASIHIPPLRERGPELRLLLSAFVEETRAQLGFGPVALPDDSVAELEAYAWPGNVRELRSFAHYLATTAGPRGFEAGYLSEWLGRTGTLPATGADEAATPTNASGPFRPLRVELQELERRRMSEALLATGGNQTRAAELLGVPIRTFMAKVKSHGLGRQTPQEPKR